jgi:hypothetical protein
VTEANRDWRLQGQEAYLRGITLFWQRYSRYLVPWNHDHCEFCGIKFAEPGAMPEALNEGHATENHDRWVCRECVDDFTQMFEWQLV